MLRMKVVLFILSAISALFVYIKSGSADISFTDQTITIEFGSEKSELTLVVKPGIITMDEVNEISPHLSLGIKQIMEDVLQRGKEEPVSWKYGGNNEKTILRYSTILRKKLPVSWWERLKDGVVARIQRTSVYRDKDDKIVFRQDVEIQHEVGIVYGYANDLTITYSSGGKLETIELSAVVNGERMSLDCQFDETKNGWTVIVPLFRDLFYQEFDKPTNLSAKDLVIKTPFATTLKAALGDDHLVIVERLNSIIR